MLTHSVAREVLVGVDPHSSREGGELSRNRINIVVVMIYIARAMFRFEYISIKLGS